MLLLVSMFFLCFEESLGSFPGFLLVLPVELLGRELYPDYGLLWETGPGWDVAREPGRGRGTGTCRDQASLIRLGC